jgi:BirA family transcriptional regulator, biotin operon repressor / biotin---[acetyl-CoA-carboxylase] ligase
MTDDHMPAGGADMLDAPSVTARSLARGGTWLGPIVCVARTGSTQDDARRSAAAGAPAGQTHAADRQDAGRGRQGRIWEAPPGSALLASVVLRPDLALTALPPLSLVVGLAVCDAIAERLGPGRAGIKWPNDVLVDGRKLSGVLVEASIRGERVESVVAGFGVNVRSASLSPDVARRAISLEEAGASPEALGRSALLGDVLAHLERRLRVFLQAGLPALLDDLRACDAARGRRIRGENFTGVARQIEPDGRLLIDTEAGPLLVSAGEITFEEAPPALHKG